MRIIVRMPNWVGDFVMAIPILIELKNFFPKAHITAMCKRSLSSLLECEPSVDEILPFDRDAPKEAISKIVGYDVGILLTHSLSSTLWFWRVKRRIGFKKWPRALFLTDRVNFPEKEIHLVEEYKKLLEPLGVSAVGSLPRIILSQEEIALAKEKLPTQGSIIGMNPGAAYGSAKCWPKERFQELTRQLLEEDPHRTVLFFGDQTSHDMIEEIVAPFKERIINFCSKTSLRELAALISLCHVLVTNDSGPMHMAAALKVPLVALFGSTNEIKTGPYQFGEVIHKHVSCSPCYRRVCPIDFRCMKQIECDEVLKKVIKISGHSKC